MLKQDQAIALGFDDVSKVFRTPNRDVVALERIDLEVPQGSFISIVGPSGCGKSTLLTISAGLERPSSGQVLINGVPVDGPSGDVGFVFQEDSTLPWRSALRNVTFGMEAQGVPRRERVARAREMLELVGLSDFADQPPSRLSGGMRQRVAIARTLALEPKILLMDEPFGALDHQTRLILSAELVRIWQETGTTVLFVTHDIDEAVILAEEVWVMSYRPGRIIDRIPVDLDYPRGLEVVSTERFSSISGRIWKSLQQESLAGFDDQANNAKN
jgi:NitT/TauT family transport system ATP-binding protein